MKCQHLFSLFQQFKFTCLQSLWNYDKILNIYSNKEDEMKKTFRIKVYSVVICLLLLAGCGKTVPKDEHEGQVLVNDGFKEVWITPVPEVEPSTLVEEDFSGEGENVKYTGSFYSVKNGVDVSYHQFDIDWKKVAEAGIEFAIIRVGYRGYTVGSVFPDEYYEANLKGSIENGLDTGVYFFSQAVNVQEAIEEAEYVIELIKGYDLTLPVFFDWESEPGYRVDGLSFQTMNDCAVAFCETVRNAGYQPGVYFSKQQGYYAYDLGRLSDYVFWVTNPGDFPDFYYAGDIWQYSMDNAVIPGIPTPTDLNMMFIEPDYEVADSSSEPD